MWKTFIRHEKTHFKGGVLHSENTPRLLPDLSCSQLQSEMSDISVQTFLSIQGWMRIKVNVTFKANKQFHKAKSFHQREGTLSLL